MTSMAARFATASAFAALIGCSSNHDLLAQKPEGPGSDGAANDGPSPFPDLTPDAPPPVDAGDPEPPGPWSLTIVNGVVDMGPVRFCFVPVVEGGEAEPDPFPVPPTSGLAFGAHLVVSAIAGIDLATTDLHPYLVAQGTGSAAFSCRQIARPTLAIVDGGSDGGSDASLQRDADSDTSNAPAYFSLPLIPAGTLGEARSYLAVATGCAHAVSLPDGGGADARALDAGDADAEAGSDTVVDTGACGTGFGPTTLGLSLVRLSRRTNPSKLGFQTVNASNAASPASLVVEQATTAASVYIADTVAFGQITPRAQPTFVSKANLGVIARAALLRVSPSAGGPSFPDFQTDLATILLTNQVAEADLAEATNFTFVLLGARPGRSSDAGEAPFRIGLVENAPKSGDAD